MKQKVLIFLLLIIPFQLWSQTASFTSNLTVGCLPLVVNYDNTSTNATSYLWDFGNGAQSTLQDPTTVYTQPGNYTVQLIATGLGGSDTIISTNYIEVLQSPTADFQFTQTGPDCEDDNIFNFQNQSSNAISYLWDFGDGNVSTDINPTYTYTTSGSHVINLIATNTNGCSSNKLIPALTIEPNPDITATSDANSWCDTNHTFILTSVASNYSNVNWTWDFGDGNSTNTNLISTTHQYNSSGLYNIHVTGTTPLGCSNTILASTIEIHPEPTSHININSSSACEPFDAEFDIHSNANISSVFWDFGDGSTINGADSISHTYVNDGIFNIVAVISDTNGCAFSVDFNQSLEILPSPSAQFSATNTYGCTPLIVQFSSSTNINNYIQWNFGDDSTFVSQSSPSHVYNSNGIFYPQLIVTDSIGCSTTYHVDTINTGQFNADFDASTLYGCAPLSVDFTSLTSGASNWHWDFGDGNTSSLANPTHLFTSIDTFSVSLVTWNNNGCMDTVMFESYIETYGDIISLPPTDTIIACSPYEFQPNAQNIGMGNWVWDFGDGTTGQGSNPSHTYEFSGNFTVSLTSQSPNGCTYSIPDFAQLTIDGMNIDLAVSSSDCDSSSVTIDNNSTGIASEFWLIDQDSIISSSLNYSLNSSDPTVIQYNATSNIGCVSTQYIPIFFDCLSSDSSNVVISPPLDTMPMDPTNPGPIVTYVNITYNCGPELVTLISPFVNSQSYYWDFGDGFSSTDQNPTHLYNTSGIFHVNHQAISNTGDTSTMVIEYFITQIVIDADFSYTESYNCNTSEVNFTSTTPNAISWLWDFDTGSTANTSTATHSYPLNNNSKNVSLTVTDTNGCSSTKSSVIYFFEPTISVDYDSLICYGDTITIEAQSNFLYTYQWDMDDGNTINNQYANHVYQNPGTYNVTLEVFDNQGCSRNIALGSIEVFQPISTFTPNSNMSICTGESIPFFADNQSASHYNWSFGSYNGSPTPTFNSPGIFDVSLQVTEMGCVGETTYNQLVTVNEAIADFTIDQLNACYPIHVNFQDLSNNAISWLWNFGDGNTSTNQNPHHSFNSIPNNDITLTIWDANGCTDSASINNIQTLNADFTVSDTIICSNTIASFTSNSLMANSWNWNFGDGTTSTLENPTHSYSSVGIYDVSLIIDDGQGCIDTIVKESLVEVQQVIAQFTYTSPTACPPIISSFNNGSSGATLYEWNFGDSSTSTLTSPTHIYTSAGTYNITLIASNDIGCTDTVNSHNPILVPGPILDYSINTLLGCDSLEIEIQNNSVNALSYYWDFGDGSNSSANNPLHVYSNPGSYIVTLIAEDTMGCESFLTYSQPVEIINTPNADFTINSNDICIPEPISLINTSTNATNYNWTFGQQTSSLQNSSFIVYIPGQQEIELIAINQICSDTVSHLVTGHFQPAVSISDPGILCTNEGIVQIQANPLGLFNTNITWSGNGLVNSNSGEFDPALVTGSTTIYASSNGVCASEDSLTLTVQDPPDASIITSDIFICEGESINSLQSVNPGGLWIGPQTHPLSGNIYASNITAGNYTISYVMNGICSNQDSIQLIVLPQTNASIVDPGVICSNESSILLNATSNGGVWSGNSISQNGEININDLGIGSFDFYYTIAGDCPSNDSIEINIEEFNNAQILNNYSICEGANSINLNALNSGGIWSGIGVVDTYAGVFNSNNLNSGSFIVMYETKGNCPDIDSTIIKINPLPIIDYELEHSTYCLGDAIHVINNSPTSSSDSYLWYLNDSLISIDSHPKIKLGLGNYLLSLHVTNQFGCSNKFKDEESLNIYDTTPLPAPEIIRSTVINDQDVYTEWAPKQTSTNAIKEYVLFKSSDQVNYEYLGTLDPEMNYYTDLDVDVYEENYTYYIVSINQCNIPSDASNISSSVLLGYDKPNEFQTKLKWTSYEKWKQGVNRYEIQKINEFGNWEVIKVVNHNVNESIIDP